MADKSFGVKDINLIGASGTPEIESPNNLNIKATNVAISTDMSVGGELTVTDTFLKPQAVGLGTTTATGRDAGISTATGTIIYIPAVGMQVYAGNEGGWKTIDGTSASSSEPLNATGGTKTTDGSYTVHTFLSSQNFVVTSGSASIEYLIVAGGGGGGGQYQGGGGGAGGLRTNLSGHPLSTNNPSFTVSPTGGNGSGSYTVTVGGGGNGTSTASASGTDGDPSYFGPPASSAGIEAEGGGGAGGYDNNGRPGGSGGGSGDKSGTAYGGYGYNPLTPSPVVTTGWTNLGHPYPITQGNDGGGSSGTYGSPYAAGGGGGAGGGGYGINGDDLKAYDSNGGLGSQVLIAGPSGYSGVGAIGPNGQGQWYCGGGGGGSADIGSTTAGMGGAGSATNAPTGGWSGGGPGGPNGSGSVGPGVNGGTNTGGGGGGAVSPGSSPYPGTGGNGGSGIVIIRYLT